MQFRNAIATGVRYAGLMSALFATVLNPNAPFSLNAQSANSAKKSAAPAIQHVIIILGENRSFDHVFATYVPKHGETVSNLLSKGIVNADGTPGPNYTLSAQFSAQDTTTYSLSPGGKALYTNISPVIAGGAMTPYFSSIAQAKQIEPFALPENYYKFLTTGGTGLNSYVDVDTRIPDVFNLGSSAFQLTPGVKYPGSNTMTMQTALCTASIKCGSNLTVI
jgi:phospholipase C